MSSAPRTPVWRLTVAVVLVGTVVLIGGVAIGVLADGVSDPLAQPDPPSAATAHENPEELGGDFELGALERRLVADLRERARQGALDLGPETYEQARDQLGDEQYRQLLDEYDELSGGDGTDERLFLQAQRSQQNFTGHATAYWETYQRYERVTGHDPMGRSRYPVASFETDFLAKAVARQLEERANRANASARAAIAAYERINETEGDDYSEFVASLGQARDDIVATQEEVRREQFTPTRLSLVGERATISPANPLELAGRLTLGDGRPLDGRTVTFEIGAQRVETTTNETGWFDLTYRPTRLPTNTTSLDVRFRPADGSGYLGDSQSVDVTVERATPSVTASVTPSETAFDGTVTVAGRVSADDAGLPAVPYVVIVGGQVLAYNETDGDGRFARNLSMPADVESGQRSVTVRVPANEDAVAGETASTTVTVLERDTTLSLTTTEESDDLLAVTGILETETGDRVDNQSVDLRVGGTTVGTATTNRTGVFEQVVAVPESVADDAGDGSVTANATFDGAGTNLRSASAETTVAAPGGGTGFAVPAWAAVPVVLVLAAGAGYWFYGRRVRPERHAPSRREAGGRPNGAPATEDTAASLERAKRLLEDGHPAAATQVGYAALRWRLQPAERGQTHWEFYRQQRRRLDERSGRALRTVTEHYERAAFAPDETDAAVAAETLEAIRTIEEHRSSES